MNKRNYWIYPPVTVSIETSTRCPANCIMCPHGSLQRRRNKMPTNQVIELLDQIDWKCEVQFAWVSEPLCDIRVPSFVGYATKKGLRTLVNTNGFLLTEDLAKKLFENGLTLLNFSVDSVVPKTHAKIRRGLDLSTVLKNYQKTVKIAKEMNANTQIWVSRVQLPSINDSIYETWRFYRYFKKTCNHIQTSPYRKQGGPTDQTLKLNATPKRNYCWFIENDMSISVDGDVPLCSCNYELTTLIGNVFEKPILEVWNHPLRHKIAMQIRRKGMASFKGCRETELKKMTISTIIKFFALGRKWI